ncbi:hypothetical protein E5F05_13370 [Deinococcus metallilatus]|uniref:Nucleotidyltransferase n=1 Tax=Deinococcus metallilatus TaxID=1211322 RepID=A0AAJ5JYR9_9DEIO|nr:hypothetical protein [Deinococcus metallilatus]MBB5294053.1 putative nucleotidyltransferase [Deinococcus metallilatus]QBY08841.1 hypothetical protein E5F05_13370 [Deinococcus metallilatus]RXJ09985.1 hypothetical protein ERJ73_12200 [Deinococcus metallilatus]TLK28078.1 hypothetical protein FCS05_09180 [Deinococcus metallilatus]GMA16612.1 hypothetical protein GCM10025871_29430 [Deinococcus metallilatus]
MPADAAQARLEAALPAALTRITSTPGVYAVLWCGSAQRGEADAHSDLDVHALVTGDHRWRSSFTLEGVLVEVFHNPARKVRALLEEPDHATVAMFAQGRALVNHPELAELMARARAVHLAGPSPRALTPFERHLLVDEVVEARATAGDPLHPLLVANATRRAVRALYAARGWWEVKPRHWLRDLNDHDPVAARHLHAALTAPRPGERQAALEALALCVLDSLAYGESVTEAQAVP